MDYNFDLGVEDTKRFVRETRTFTVGDQLRKSARMWPDQVAISEPGRELTFAELDDRTDRLAVGILSAGYEPNKSTIAVLAENRRETVELLLACAKIGILVAPLNWRLNRDELVHCVDLVEPRGLVVSDRFVDRLSWIESDCDTTPKVIKYDSQIKGSFSELLSAGKSSESAPDVSVNPEQGFVVLNTSGTTGLPKGVVISHRAEIARAVQVTIDYGLNRGDSYPGWPPMFHMGGIEWVVVTTYLGGTFYPIDGFDPEQILDVVLESSDPISWLYLVPGTIEPFVELFKRRNLDQEHLPTIRAMAALPDLIDPSLISETMELFDAPFQNTYGASETGHVMSGSKLPVGTPPSDVEFSKTESPLVEIKLIDEDWTEVENRGELAVRGPALCSGYVDAPLVNEEDFQDGWFRTGDIFTRQQDGTYNFVSRRKYLIKSGGENIYPTELETPITKLDAVNEVVVVKAPDEKWGEVPRMFVEIADIADLDEMRSEILSRLEGQVARYKLPHYIEFCDPGSLPRSTSGKIARSDLEDNDPDMSTRVRSP
ncbi:class I adenylate-forming enzyme family protein [Halococcus sediminicola]|uniref:class I adenylate-forming enzyme family protein n=1 Tax=Halococcus sediminicola TaxID=1264579 RepID=UPI00067978E0|nr:class I adenylate-forming enzyme family protein [Halococcus sediminicola]